MRRNYKSFRTLFVDYPEFPDVEKFVSARDGIVYINRSARPDAKLVRLIFR